MHEMFGREGLPFWFLLFLFFSCLLLIFYLLFASGDLVEVSSSYKRSYYMERVRYKYKYWSCFLFQTSFWLGGLAF